MSIAVIANPCAGRGRGERTAKLIIDQLKHSSLDYQFFYTEYSHHATELAYKAAKNHKIITAIGGDGTINEVLAGMYKSKSHLGIIPGGTGNDYVRGLNLPHDPVKALKVILNGKAQKMDIIKETDRVFGVVSTLGFPSTVLEYVNAQRDSLIKGQYVFAAAIIKTIKNLRSYQVGLTIDGNIRSLQTIGILLMNMPYGGGGLKFAPDARYDDGYISAVIVKNTSRFTLMKTLPLVYKGHHKNHPLVEIIRCKSISITSKESLQKSFDGDLTGKTPFNAVIVPQAVSVITG